MRVIGRGLWGGGLVLASLVLAVPAAEADVVTRTETGFVVRLASEVTAPPAEAWKTILAPAQWWQSQHTFSGDAANLSLDPQIGGCFCEVLPRPEGAPATQKPGGVQHMRVVYIEPPRAMRLVGALGPLQSEALAATMTITVKPTDTPAGKGSRILFEYVVGGFMRYKVDEIAPAVDRMLTAQLASLASKLGPIAEPVVAPPAPKAGSAPEEAAPAGEAPAKPVVPLKGAESFSLPPAGGKAPPKPAAKSDPKPEAKPDPKPEAKPDAKLDPAPAASAAKPAAPAAKPVVKAALVSPAKSALASSARAPAKAPAKPAPKAPAKAPAKPAPKAPDPEADAHRDANAAFDAALGAAPAP
ncbi:SRPBCC domain-containing protein [Novosphingobium sp.]|uniref:SRPBCC domain-containing protein n=1 Tax=Novosphingobium sp. TaxID=1874826 RepID=UPI00262B8353|nr:SRPBCC domain-containing protein [Novosphingobium sp.]